MPRIRTIKPNFWSHPNPPSPWARLLFLAMLNWADDHGIGTANPKELAAFAFPNDEEMDSCRTTVLLREIYRSYDVAFYVVRGRPYYAIKNWKDHQKVNNPAKEYYNPPPEEAETWLYQDEQVDSGSPTVVLREPSGTSGVQEVGNRKLEIGNKGGGSVSAHSYVSDARVITKPADDAAFTAATAERDSKLSGPVSIGATRLVATVVRNGAISDADRTVLRIKTSQGLAQGRSDEDMAECLRVWLKKNHLGPNALLTCLTEVDKLKLNGRQLTNTEVSFTRLDDIANKHDPRPSTDEERRDNVIELHSTTREIT